MEELAIGLESGSEEFLFGDVTGVARTDSTVYVLDRQNQVVRIFDLDGKYVGDIGKGGTGPGEFNYPQHLIVDSLGRVLVRDDSLQRISVFSGSGELLDTWPLDPRLRTTSPMILGEDGRVWTRMNWFADSGAYPERVRGWVPYDDTGSRGEPVAEPILDAPLGELVGPMSQGPVPFAPRPHTAFSPLGATVAGVSDKYRLEIKQIEGPVMVVERIIEPVPVVPEEAEWHRRLRTAQYRRQDPDWSWNGPAIPQQKPFFERIVPDQGGRIWVERVGPGQRVEACDENPGAVTSSRIRQCWVNTTIIDVFGLSGRFLGRVDVPPGFSLAEKPWIRDDVVLTPIEDVEGTIQVKMFRLVVRGTQ